MTSPVGMDPSVQSREEIMRGRIDPPNVEVSTDDHALITYTSGTTGDRKGSLHIHWGMLVNSVRTAHWKYHYASSVHLSVLPFFHITGLHFGMGAPVYTGGTMVILSRWDREAAIQAVEKYRCTHWTNIVFVRRKPLLSPGLELFLRNSAHMVLFQYDTGLDFFSHPSVGCSDNTDFLNGAVLIVFAFQCRRPDFQTRPVDKPFQTVHN